MSAFIIKVKTDNTGTSNNDQFTLPGNSSYSYNFDVDWGDGSPVETINSGSSWTHTFTGGVGTYSVEITENVAGGFPTIYFNNGGDRLKLLEIEQWGTNRWDTFNGAFFGCSNLTITATDEATADTGGVTNFAYAWVNCSSLTSFPLIDTSSGTNFYAAWYNCSSLTSFPLIGTSSGTNFAYAWFNCSSLTSFPLIDTSSGTNFFRAWYDCSSLTSFPLIDMSSGTNFRGAWYNCSSLTSFPLIDTSSGTDFYQAWYDCSSLTSFPLIDMSSGTNFSYAWYNCSSLTSFPTLDFRSMSNGANTFLSVTLDTASYDAILEKSFLNNTNNGVTFHGGNSTYFKRGKKQRDILTAAPRNWTITDGGYDATHVYPDWKQSIVPQLLMRRRRLSGGLV